MLNVLYLVHDLNDPAVRRRVMMLRAGGASVRLAGFSRRPNALAAVDGVEPIDLGRTYDGRFLQRLVSVGRAAIALSARLDVSDRPDVIIGRNLEMLALAHRARALIGSDVPVVYECLDVHRLMLRDDAAGQAMRSVERRLAGRSALLLTSSPAFVERYFARYHPTFPVHLLENRVLELSAGPTDAVATEPPRDGEPWRIGWFGALRCRRSIELLAAFTRRMEGRFVVVMRGRPAYEVFDDFDGFVAREPYLSFGGAYRNPEDLDGIYGEVHFSWLPDFFEEGLNSAWLLPNRLYEGCRYSTVPIAVADTETGRFLRQRHLGLRLREATVDDLCKVIANGLDDRAYRREVQRVRAVDAATWRVDRADCVRFVDRLSQLSGDARVAA